MKQSVYALLAACLVTPAGCAPSDESDLRTQVELLSCRLSSDCGQSQMLGITMLHIVEDEFASELPETSSVDATVLQIARAAAFLDCSLAEIEDQQRHLVPFKTETGLEWAGSGSPPDRLVRQAANGDADARFDLLVGGVLASDPVAERGLETAASLGDPGAAFLLASRRFNEGELEEAQELYEAASANGHTWSKILSLADSTIFTESMTPRSVLILSWTQRRTAIPWRRTS